MKLKLTEKITIWTLSIFIVVSFLFVDIKIDFKPLFVKNQIVEELPIRQFIKHETKPQFQRIELVEVDVSNLVIQPKASLLLTVVGFVAFSIFLSLGAHYAARSVESVAETFVDWYVAQANNPSAYDPNNPSMYYMPVAGTSSYIMDYLNNTGQLGTVNPESYVLPAATVQAIYDAGDWFWQHSIQNETNWIKFRELNFIDWNGSNRIATIPMLNGLPSTSVISITVGNLHGGPFIGYVNSSINYFILNNDVLTSVQKIDVGGSYRLKLTLRKRSNELVDLIVKYTANIPYETMELLSSATYLDIVYRPNNAFFIVPFFDNYTLAQNFALAYSFKMDSVADTTESIYYPAAGFTWDDLFVALNSSATYSIGNMDDLVDETGFPVGMPIDDRDGNYYVVPTPDVNNPTPTYPTPVPVPDEDNWVYVPPNPSTGAVDMDWTDLLNPTTPAPTATAENTLNGGIFQALGNWIVSTFFGAINSIMGFWEAFVNNLFTVWNDMVDWWQQLIPDTWFDNYWTNLTNALVSLIYPSDMEQKFTDFNAYFENKFGLLIYPIELIFSVFERFATLQPQQCLVFNGYNDPVQNYQIIKPFTFCFDEFAEDNNIEWMFIMLQVFMNAILVYAFAMGWFKSYESIRDQ